MKSLLLLLSLLATLGCGRLSNSDQLTVTLKDDFAVLVFQDSSIDEELKSFIVDDINQILGYYEKIDFYSPNFIKIPIDGKEVMMHRNPKFLGGGNSAPHEFIWKFRFGFSNEGIKHIVVTDELVAMYREALNSPEEKMKKYRELVHFISLLRGDTNTPFSSEEHLWFHSSASDHRDQWLAEIEETDPNPFQLDFKNPSILEIYQVEIVEEGISNPWMAPTYFLDDDEKMKRGMPLLYHDGRWKILISVPGT